MFSRGVFQLLSAADTGIGSMDFSWQVSKGAPARDSATQEHFPNAALSPAYCNRALT